MYAITRLFAAAALCALTTIAHAATVSVPISDLTPVNARQDYGQLQFDRDVSGAPLRIGGRAFAQGAGMHANGEAVYDLDGAYDEFSAWVGVDDSMIPYKGGSVVFQVYGDGKLLTDSGLMNVGDPAKRLSVSVAKMRELKLVVTDGGDGIQCDHADWADAVLTTTAASETAQAPASFTVRAPNLTAELSAQGEIVRLQYKGSVYASSRARTLLAGCRLIGTVHASKAPRGGVSFSRKLESRDHKHTCSITDTLTPTANSIRWVIAIHGEGAPWSTPIITSLRLPITKQTRFWTAWYTPDSTTEAWRDPLIPTSLHPMRLSYGDSFALPIATLLHSDNDQALSLVLSPEDTTLNLSLGVTTDGTVTFSRANRRISPRGEVRFTMDLVAHEPDIRSGLAWMVNRYPAYFNPPNPTAHTVCGGGAYSGWEGALDVEKMRAMAFGVNWKASFDFPYMSMFLPPVTHETDRWRRFDADSGGGLLPDVKTYTSRKQMNDYSARMRAAGFHVLNYFNVTEFGAGIKPREQIDKTLAPADAWRDATTYLYMRIADGILPMQNGSPIGTWGGAVVMDCGGVNYRRHLLEQAKRHIDKLPMSSGICIDRTDWLRFYNPKEDDGLSWYNDKPARSVQVSWQRLMTELGPLMHKADKVIFANTLNARLDILRQVDGIYAEFGNRPGDFNAAAFLGLRKPVLEWTASEGDLKPDPDAFFQRHLYMGVFPTVPFPGNDHTITPNAWAERYYLDYGPMLDELRGRTWVLIPRAVETSGGEMRANIFSTPKGYVIPVVFGGTASHARIHLRNLPAIANLNAWDVEALHPGSAARIRLTPVRTTDGVAIDVPLRRGCAIVRIGW